jgi:CRP-like cAMP-binding protein
MDKVAILSQSGYFAGISPQSLTAVAEICLLKSCQKREILFTEGQKGLSVYGCLSGAVQLYKTSQDGRQVVIKMIQAGELFGEVILFEADRYPVTAEALATSRVFLLPKHQFICLLQREDFRNDFIAMLMRKQRYLADQIKFLTTNDVEDRLFFFIEEHYGRQKRFEPAVSKKDLAAAIGATPETLSRLLLRLKKENLLTWEDKFIEIDEHAWVRFK